MLYFSKVFLDLYFTRVKPFLKSYPEVGLKDKYNTLYFSTFL